MSQEQRDAQFKHLSDIQVRHLTDLLNHANVVGVGIGIARKDGEITDELALVVMVSQKVPVAQLAPHDVIPHQIEGARVDVQATGGFDATPTGDFSAS